MCETVVSFYVPASRVLRGRTLVRPAGLRQERSGKKIFVAVCLIAPPLSSRVWLISTSLPVDLCKEYLVSSSLVFLDIKGGEEGE